MNYERRTRARRAQVGLLLCLLGLLSAPDAPAAGRAEAKTFSVVTSFYPMYIMALNVTKGVPGVMVTNLAPAATGCLHDYTLTTDAMKELARAAVFVVNGAGMESYLEKVAAQYPHLAVVRLADGVQRIRGADGEENAHVWVSPANAAREVRALARALAQADPAHAVLYEKNAAAYCARLDELRSRMAAELRPARGKKIMTFHEAFPYFAAEYGLVIAAVVEREPGSSPSAKEIAAAIDVARREKIAAIFAEPQYPAGAAETIARESGARVFFLDPAASGPDDPDAYIAIMEKNLTVLKEALL